MRKLKEINDSLPDLFIGILFLGMLAELIPVWFLDDKAGYTIGLIAGILCALASAFHMAWTIDRAFDYDEGTATKCLQKSTALRYGVQLFVLFFLAVTEAGNPLAAFLGMWSLKVAAYITPITHKLFRR